jgi:hypothetical protein
MALHLHHYSSDSHRTVPHSFAVFCLSFSFAWTAVMEPLSRCCGCLMPALFAPLSLRDACVFAASWLGVGWVSAASDAAAAFGALLSHVFRRRYTKRPWRWRHTTPI